MSDTPPPFVGIDLGTTRTVVVAADRGRYPVASFDVGGSFRDYLPSVAAHAQGRWWFGEAARERLAAPTSDTFGVASVKRLVGELAPDDALPGGPSGATALSLLEQYLRWVHTMLHTRSNLSLPPSDNPLTAMVAVPANAGTRQRYLTLEAFGRAGFSVQGMLSEPTAAAIEYAHRDPLVLSPRSPKRYVVVYDLGGGTFDTAAVSLEGQRFALLTSEGIGRLGGADFDALLLKLVVEQLRTQGKSAAELEGLPQAAALEMCRDAKEGLSPHSRRLVVDPGALLPDASPVVIATQTLYARCQPLIERTIELVERLLRELPRHGIDPEDPRQLGALYLVGGSVAFPPVARALRQKYGRKIKLSAQPHASTAMGLAIAADPGAEIRVREATTRHFGVWREGNDGREKIFDPILSKDTLPSEDGLDLVVERRYRPVHSIGHLRFLECTALGEDGRPGGDVTPWAQLHFPYDPALAEQPLEAMPIERRTDTGDEIVETYVRAPDGTITVAIANPTAALHRTWVLGALR